jgi:hypothetical protein
MCHLKREIMKNLNIEMLEKIGGGVDWSNGRFSTNVEDRRTPGVTGFSDESGQFYYVPSYTSDTSWGYTTGENDNWTGGGLTRDDHQGF